MDWIIYKVLWIQRRRNYPSVKLSNEVGNSTDQKMIKHVIIALIITFTLLVPRGTETSSCYSFHLNWFIFMLVPSKEKCCQIW